MELVVRFIYYFLCRYFICVKNPTRFIWYKLNTIQSLKAYDAYLKTLYYVSKQSIIRIKYDPTCSH